jgi:HEAT repeat protein
MTGKPPLEQALSECVKQLSQENLRHAQALLVREERADEVLQQYLLAASERQEWEAIQSLVACAFARPSRKYVDTLCNLLEQANPALNNEDIADLLGEIADPSSVSTLSRCTEMDFPMDESHSVNQKVIWALGKIRTPAAVEVLTKAAQSSVESIREEAQSQLDWVHQNE